MQEPSQIELAELTNILQSTISAIENERVNLGVERARALGSALNCHPAVLVFPGWRLDHKSTAWQIVPAANVYMANRVNFEQ